MKNKVLIAFVIVAAFTVSILFAANSISGLLSSREKIGVKIGNNIFSVTVSDAESEREKGLSGRLSLPKGSGMLFIYENPRIPVFWMRDMNFPIDIIWIREGRVVGAVMDANPQKDVSEAKLERYSPAGFIDSALEVPAGTVRSLGISVGDPVLVDK